MVPAAFLLSIAGLGVSLAGFSGLVAALRRGSKWRPLDVYRLRQIPEMGLATSALSLATLPVAEIVGSAAPTVRCLSAVGLVFVTSHIILLVFRTRGMGLRLSAVNYVSAGLIDLATIAAAVATIVFTNSAGYEALLILLLGRAMLAFVLVLGDLPTTE